MKGKTATVILSAFQTLLSISSDQIENVGVNIPIPTFESPIIEQLCTEAITALKRQNVVLQLSSPIYVVGDIHGNIFDLIRILTYTKIPPFSRILFLGDYVDRGEFSVEVICLLLSLTILYPDHIFLLRGNHEFDNMNSTYGFQSEIISQYGSNNLFFLLNEVFLWMPLVAIVDNAYFCVHGGLSPTATSIEQLTHIRRPLQAYDVEFVADLVWSDPSKKVANFEVSARGLGVQFGAKCLESFLNNLGLKTIIRAHQCVPQGISTFDNKKLFTVFSCSNYADAKGNRTGLILLEPDKSPELFSLPPIPQLPRSTIMSYLILKNEAKFESNNSLAMNIKLKDLQITRPRRLSYTRNPVVRPYISQNKSEVGFTRDIELTCPKSIKRDSSFNPSFSTVHERIPPLK